MITVEERSELAAPAEQVWRHATSLAGINRELAPFLRMSAPEGVTDLQSLDPEPGVPLFASTVWALGVFPVDRMRLTLEVLEPMRFVEASSLIWMREWRHERVVEPVDGGCALTDRLTPVARVPGMTWLARAGVRALFRHRHQVVSGLFPPL